MLWSSSSSGRAVDPVHHQVRAVDPVHHQVSAVDPVHHMVNAVVQFIIRFVGLLVYIFHWSVSLFHVSYGNFCNSQIYERRV
jgi:hypothetical protein